MKHLTTLFIFIFCVSTLQAIPPVKPTGKTVQKLTRAAGAARGVRAPYHGTHGAVMGVNYYLLRNMPTPAATAAVRAQRPWWEQVQRNFTAWKLKHQRRQRDLLLQKAEQARLAREQLEATLPKLVPQDAFETADFAALLTDQIPPQELPLLMQPDVLYRGLAVSGDGEALKNILQNGLLLKDAGTEANTRHIAMSGGSRGALSALAKRPITNLTSFPVNAAEWATKRLTEEKQLLVVVGVGGQTRSGKIVTIDQDIPAAQITHVVVPLQTAQGAVWCEISLTQDGQFLAIPYR